VNIVRGFEDLLGDMARYVFDGLLRDGGIFQEGGNCIVAKVVHAHGCQLGVLLRRLTLPMEQDRISDQISDYFSKFGRKGGFVRAKTTREQRKTSALKASRAAAEARTKKAENRVR
jgi:hypothetical protein